MKEKFSLKDALFNPVKVQKIASEIGMVYVDFNKEAFIRDVLVSFPELELKERIYHIRDMLGVHLPNGYAEAVKILLLALPSELDSDKTDNDFGDFIYAPYSEYVVTYGCNNEHLNLSLHALREITKRFSVEFAIREFINTFPEATLKMLKECSLSENYHERRLASEGLRPKLPWAKKLTLDYKIPLMHLNNLFCDKTRYVTRSVANHINDISKLDASLVLLTLKQWKVSGKQKTKEMDYMIQHALRTLVKQGNEEALEFLGYRKDPHIEVLCFDMKVSEVKIGESLVFMCDIIAKENVTLLLDYIVHFRTKNGNFSTKVHKLKKLVLKNGEKVKMEKNHLFKANMTTRKFYVGEHKIELQINGKIFSSLVFELISNE